MACASWRQKRTPNIVKGIMCRGCHSSCVILRGMGRRNMRTATLPATYVLSSLGSSCWLDRNNATNQLCIFSLRVFYMGWLETSAPYCTLIQTNFELLAGENENLLFDLRISVAQRDLPSVQIKRRYGSTLTRKKNRAAAYNAKLYMARCSHCTSRCPRDESELAARQMPYHTETTRFAAAFRGYSSLIASSTRLEIAGNVAFRPRPNL